MFIGHYAIALAIKKTAPEISLGTLIVAAQFLDDEDGYTVYEKLMQQH